MLWAREGYENLTAPRPLPPPVETPLFGCRSLYFYFVSFFPTVQAENNNAWI